MPKDVIIIEKHWNIHSKVRKPIQKKCKKYHDSNKYDLKAYTYTIARIYEYDSQSSTSSTRIVIIDVASSQRRLCVARSSPILHVIYKPHMGSAGTFILSWQLYSMPLQGIITHHIGHLCWKGQLVFLP